MPTSTYRAIIMLIKVYNQPDEHAVSGYLRLYEDVSDVVVHESSYGPNQTGPEHVGPFPTTHISADPAEAHDVKFVDFTQNGIRHRLAVANRAYVCNDEGRTIEKVSAV